MKKTFSIVLVFLVVLSTFSMLAPQTKAEPDDTPLEVAEKAACYVTSQAVPENGGCKWNDRPGDAALVGEFLVLLHEKTGSSIYLDYAKCAAQWLISEAFPNAGGYMWWHDGWRLSSTVYYVGEFLLKMYKVTGNSTYFDYAKGAAQWMVAMAEPEDGGWFIPYNPPGKFGSQAGHGISPGREAQTVTFLLHMYQETGNTTYLTYVKGTAEWLISGPDKEVEYGGYKWRHDRPYSLKYPFGPNAMIAHFFYETYQELGNETYLEHANGAVQWILSQAVPDDGGYKWPRFPSTTEYYLLPLMEYPFNHVNDLLLVGYSITSNSTYLEYAKKHADWVLSQAISESGGYKFPYVEGGSHYDAYQNARAYNFLSWMSDVTEETSYSGYADGALTWIINNATVTDGCYKWKTIPSPPYYPWLFSGGASGIGYYLISAAPIGPQDLDPWEYCPYVYLDWGYSFPWDTTPDLPVNVLYTGTYFWGDLRVIQYWFHWEIDYMWWLIGFVKSAYEYTMGWGWTDPLRQTAAAAGGADWEPVFVIVDDEGSIDSVLWRWHYNWLKFDLTIDGAELFHPTYEETHIKLWWAIGSHTPLTKYFAIDIPILLKIASVLKHPMQFDPVIGQAGDLTKPPLYELYEQGITYPCGMQEWDEDLALNLGFDPSDLKYVNNPTLAYSELLLPPFLSVVAESPVNILVTAPDGLRVGYDSVTGSTVNEIEGATYSGAGTEPQAIIIPSALPGVYIVDRFGTGTGTYTITIESRAEDGSITDIQTWTGTASPGELERGSIQMFEDGTFVDAPHSVIPEVPLGTIMASAAIIIALTAYIAVPKWRRKRQHANL